MKEAYYVDCDVCQQKPVTMSIKFESTFTRKLDVRSLTSNLARFEELCAFKSKIFDNFCHKQTAASKKHIIMCKFSEFENIYKHTATNKSRTEYGLHTNPRVLGVWVGGAEWRRLLVVGVLVVF